MRSIVNLVFSIAIVFFVSFIVINTVLAESLNVSLRVGDTQISFEGYASPGAFITITQNSAVVATTTASVAGNWSTTFYADNPGIQSFSMYIVDTYGDTSPTVTYDLNLVANTLTTIGNIVFPPTLSNITLPVTNTQNLIVSGLTHPLSTLTLFLSSGDVYTISPNSDGTWLYTLPMTDFAGSYTFYLTATMPGNYFSVASNSRSFYITTSDSPSTSSSVSQSSSTPSPSIFQAMPSPSAGVTIFKKPSPSPTLVDPQAEPVSLNLIMPTIAQSVLTLKILSVFLISIYILKLLIKMLFFPKSKSSKYNRK